MRRDAMVVCGVRSPLMDVTVPQFPVVGTVEGKASLVSPSK
jgi:hypothetical protein